MEKELEKLLSQAGLRVTQPRRRVFVALERASAPLSQVEIAKQIPDVDRVSVYRTVDLFLKVGVIAGVSFGWKQKYELTDPFRPHHHHLNCLRCGRVESIHSENIEKAINGIASSHAFKITGHVFEISGFCVDCRKSR